MEIEEFLRWFYGEQSHEYLMEELVDYRLAELTPLKLRQWQETAKSCGIEIKKPTDSRESVG